MWHAGPGGKPPLPSQWSPDPIPATACWDQALSPRAGAPRAPSPLLASWCAQSPQPQPPRGAPSPRPRRGGTRGSGRAAALLGAEPGAGRTRGLGAPGAVRGCPATEPVPGRRSPRTQHRSAASPGGCAEPSGFLFPRWRAAKPRAPRRGGRGMRGRDWRGQEGMGMEGMGMGRDEKRVPTDTGMGMGWKGRGTG